MGYPCELGIQFIIPPIAVNSKRKIYKTPFYVIIFAIFLLFLCVM